MTYQIASNSVKGRKKEANGEKCIHGLSYRDSIRQYVYLVLADGLDESVFSQVVFVFSSLGRMAMKNAINTDASSLALMLEETVKSMVDKNVVGFSAIAWNVDEDELAVCNLGNTRIYKHTLTQGLLPLKMENERDRTIAAGTISFLPGESLVVCSDGMYQSSTFEDEIAVLLNEFDLSEAIKKVTTTSDDDMSLAFIRRNYLKVDYLGLQELLANFKVYRARMSSEQMAEKLCDEMCSMLDFDFDMVKFYDAVTLMKQHQIYPEKAQIDGVFTKAVNKLNSMPEGEEKQRFNAACIELKDILKWVFTH